MRFVAKLLVLISTALVLPCQAQPAREDSAPGDALTYALGLYAKNMGAQSHLYNGSEYIVYNSTAGEHPYYKSDWLDGTVFYDGERYDSVPLLYDLSTDKLITENAYGRPLQMITNKVKYFILDGHTFVYLPEAGIKEGFYDLLYAGETKVYKRTKKSLQKNISGTVLEKKFEESLQYFIHKNETIFQSGIKRICSMRSWTRRVG
jgi:hypothetical protein